MLGGHAKGLSRGLRFDARRFLWSGLEVVGTNGAALVVAAALNGTVEHLVDFVRDGLDQITIAAQFLRADELFDFAGDDDDFSSLFLLWRHIFGVPSLRMNSTLPAQEGGKGR